MKIGIIGAMAQEVTLLREHLENQTTWQKAGATFYQGTIGKHEVIVVQSGIGKGRIFQWKAGYTDAGCSV